MTQGDEGGPGALPVTLAGASSQQHKERLQKEKHPTAIHKELAHRYPVYERLHFRSSRSQGHRQEVNFLETELHPPPGRKGTAGGRQGGCREPGQQAP